MKKGKVPVAQEKEPDYNVPYFTQFLVPKQPHFTRGGMHAAASQAEKAREKAGFVDDDGVHYLGKDNAEKLAKELAKTEASYLFSENGGIVWRSPEEEARFKAESEHKAMKPPAPVKRGRGRLRGAPSGRCSCSPPARPHAQASARRTAATPRASGRPAAAAARR